MVATGERLRRQQATTDRMVGLVAHLEEVVRSAADQEEFRVLAKEFSTLLDRLGAEQGRRSRRTTAPGSTPASRVTRR